MVLKSACLVNENSWAVDNWSIDNILTLCSIFMTGIFSFMMYCVTTTQRDIQEKQKNLELLKLRLEHSKKFTNIAMKICTFMIYNLKFDKKEYYEFNQLLSELFDMTSETEYLFDEETEKLEINVVENYRDVNSFRLSVYYKRKAENTLDKKEKTQYKELYKEYYRDIEKKDDSFSKLIDKYEKYLKKSKI